MKLINVLVVIDAKMPIHLQISIKNFIDRIMKWILLFFLALVSGLQAHEGHHVAEADPALAEVGFDAFIHWFGPYHLILLHFPIALIIMAVIAEILFQFNKNPKYEFTINFLLIAAALFAIPTAFAGLAFSEGATYTGEKVMQFFWHRFFGVSVLVLSIITVFIRYYR